MTVRDPEAERAALEAFTEGVARAAAGSAEVRSNRASMGRARDAQAEREQLIGYLDGLARATAALSASPMLATRLSTRPRRAAIVQL